jgi:transcriptional regulator with XRE-family HTH domain
MINHSRIAQLGTALRARRRALKLSLRELAVQTGVSLNTLSRVERGHVPDLHNFHKIIDWLGVPASTFLEPPSHGTTELIAMHLRADRRLTSEAASEISQHVENLYRSRAMDRPKLAAHLRSARLFSPAAGALLAEILGEMEASLKASQPD